MTRATSTRRPTTSSRPCSRAPRRTTSRSRRSSPSPQQGSFSLTMTGSATVNTMFSKMLGQSTINLVGDLRGDVGHQEAQSGAGARQHRLDVVEPEDDQPQDRRAQSAHHAARTRPSSPATSRSRSCRSPPTSTSARQMSTPPGSTGPTGTPPTARAATRATIPNRAACRTARSGRRSRTALERLRQRPRPEQRREQHRDRRRRPRDAVPRAPGVELPDRRDDAA